MTDDEIKAALQRAGFHNDPHSPYLASGSLQNFRDLLTAAVGEELSELSKLATQGDVFARVIERDGEIKDAFLTVPSIEQGRSIVGPIPMEWLADDSYHDGGPEQKAHDARFTAAAINFVRRRLS